MSEADPSLPTLQLSHGSEVVEFGHWLKRLLSIELATTAGIAPILTPREQAYITERLLQGNSELETAYIQRLMLRPEFYLTVKQHLQAILQAWDAVIDEKNTFDEKGLVTWNRQFMECFLICTDVFPWRLNIASFNYQNAPVASPVPSSGHASAARLDPPGHSAVSEHGQCNGARATEQVRESPVLSTIHSDYLALSDTEIDDTSSEDTDEDEDGSPYQEFYDLGEESLSDDTDTHEGGSEAVRRPPTPYPGLGVPESDSLDAELQRLLDDPFENEGDSLSDLDDLSSPAEHQSRAAKDASDSTKKTKKSRVENHRRTRSRPIKVETDSNFAPTISSKKRGSDQLSDAGKGLLENNHHSKRLRK